MSKTKIKAMLLKWNFLSLTASFMVNLDDNILVSGLASVIMHVLFRC